MRERLLFARHLRSSCMQAMQDLSIGFCARWGQYRCPLPHRIAHLPNTCPMLPTTSFFVLPYGWTRDAFVVRKSEEAAIGVVQFFFVQFQNFVLLFPRTRNKMTLTEDRTPYPCTQFVQHSYLYNNIGINVN